MIVAESSFLGGFSLYVENGYLKHTYSLLGLKLDTISSRDSIPAGKVNVRYEFTADKPGEFGTGGTSPAFYQWETTSRIKNGAQRAVPVRLVRRHGYWNRQRSSCRPEIRICENTSEIFPGHDRKSGIRSRPSKTKRRRSTTHLSPTLRHGSSQLKPAKPANCIESRQPVRRNFSEGGSPFANFRCLPSRNLILEENDIGHPAFVCSGVAASALARQQRRLEPAVGFEPTTC